MTNPCNRKGFLLFCITLFLNCTSVFSQTSAHEYYLSALAKDSLKDYDGAIRDLEKSISLYTDNDSLRVLHARVESEMNHNKEAYQEINQVIKHNHGSYDAYMLRGILRARKGNYEGAVSDFNSAIKINPKSAKAYYNRGLSHAYLEEIKQSIDDFTRATELDPGYSIAWFQRGYWKEISGDLTGSLNDLNKAKELMPHDKNLIISLAITNYRLNNKEQACTYLNQAREMGSEKAEELSMIMCK